MIRKTHILTMAGALVCAAQLSAADITGQPIFEDKPSRTAKIEKIISDGDITADNGFKMAKIKYLRAQLQIRAHAMALLSIEEGEAARDKDRAGLAEIKREKANLAKQAEDLNAKLHAEEGDAAVPDACVSASPAAIATVKEPETPVVKNPAPVSPGPRRRHRRPRSGVAAFGGGFRRNTQTDARQKMEARGAGPSAGLLHPSKQRGRAFLPNAQGQWHAQHHHRHLEGVGQRRHQFCE